MNDFFESLAAGNAGRRIPKYTTGEHNIHVPTPLPPIESSIKPEPINTNIVQPKPYNQLFTPIQSSPMAPITPVTPVQVTPPPQQMIETKLIPITEHPLKSNDFKPSFSDQQPLPSPFSVSAFHDWRSYI